MKVFLPMNIENFHWYLAVLNAKKKVRYMYSILWDNK